MDRDENAILTKALEILWKEEKEIRNRDIQVVGPGLPSEDILAKLSAAASRLKFKKEDYYKSIGRSYRLRRERRILLRDFD